MINGQGSDKSLKIRNLNDICEYLNVSPVIWLELWFGSILNQDICHDLWFGKILNMSPDIWFELCFGSNLNGEY